MEADTYKMPRIFTRNDPTVLRVFPPLAQEIGLNESIILLQLDFLISISREKGEPLLRDEMAWTRQSLRHLRDVWFPFWSPQTIARALWKLRDDHKLIHVTDKYNKHEYDKSQWFALNPQGFGVLRSVTLHMVQLNGTGVFQIGTDLSQDGTTIPEILSDLNIGNSVREEDDYQELLNAVQIVCKKLSALMFTEKDYQQVDILYESGVTPEQIRQHYDGKQSWWFTAYWLGRDKAQFPEPADLVKTVGKAIAFVQEGMEAPQPGGNRQQDKKKKPIDEYLKTNPQPSEDESYRL